MLEYIEEKTKNRKKNIWNNSRNYNKRPPRSRLISKRTLTSSMHSYLLLDEVLVMPEIIKDEPAEPKAEADNTYRDLDYLAYHKHRI